MILWVRIELLGSRRKKETITEKNLLYLVLEKSSKDFQRSDCGVIVVWKVFHPSAFEQLDMSGYFPGKYQIYIFKDRFY